jgi:hypothetical protein
MKKPEFTEGPQALENFKSLATAILQAPHQKQKKQTKSHHDGVSRSPRAGNLSRTLGEVHIPGLPPM